MRSTTRFEDGKLIATRVYEAPRGSVFEAWVETIGQMRGYACFTEYDPPARRADRTESTEEPAAA